MFINVFFLSFSAAFLIFFFVVVVVALLRLGGSGIRARSFYSRVRTRYWYYCRPEWIPCRKSCTPQNTRASLSLSFYFESRKRGNKMKTAARFLTGVYSCVLMPVCFFFLPFFLTTGIKRKHRPEQNERMRTVLQNLWPCCAQVAIYSQLSNDETSTRELS